MSAHADGCPNHCGLALQSTCERVATRRTSCKPPFAFAAGGQFVISRARAHKLNRARYADMVRMLNGEVWYKHRAPLYPYIFERLWGRVLCW